MRLGSSLVFAMLFAYIAVPALPSRLLAQEPDWRPITIAEAIPPGAIPDAPVPQIAVADAESSSQQSPAGQNQSAQQPNPDTSPVPAPGSSSSKPSADSTDAEKSQHEKAEEQLKAQEHQRVMGVMATFNTTSNRDALPLTPAQKFQLFFKSETDPWPFLLAGVVSGVGQADNSYAVWGQGLQGYAKRYGAAYSDAFIGNLFGNAVLTSLLREDPRYFQKGSGKFINRVLWAAASTVWCRRDNGGWGPNYANVGGNLIGAAIARAYYPASERTVSNTISDGFTVSAEGIVGSEVIEFWPDIARHHQRKKAEKAARLAAQGMAQSSTQPDSQSASKDRNQQQK
jgi:hypothetical protein